MSQQTPGGEPLGDRTENRPLAVVTGASSGIGYALARQFAEHGFDLLIAARSPRLEDAALDLAELGVEVQASQVDLATYDGVEQFYATVRSLGRPVDAAALNAGVGVVGEFARETDLADELDVVRLNVVSTVHLAKRLLADMVRRGSGRVLFTASAAAATPRPFEAVYVASKAFVHTFAAALGGELAGSGVSVTVLLPGPTETDFTHRAGLDDVETAQETANPADPAEVAREAFEALMSAQDAIVVGTTPTDHKLSP